jgi:hypothetical protein
MQIYLPRVLVLVDLLCTFATESAFEVFFVENLCLLRGLDCSRPHWMRYEDVSHAWDVVLICVGFTEV